MKSLAISARTKNKSSRIAIGVLVATLCSVASARERFEFHWIDINTREVVRWEGDTAIVRKGSPIQELNCKFNINLKNVSKAINRFGIPNQWTLISYRDDNELAEKQLVLNKQASEHGIKMLHDNRFIVDYNWVVDNSVQDMRDIARTIRITASRAGYRSQRELIGAFAAFTQALEYRIPEDHRLDENGETILTAGAMMPLETLVRRWGDCDSKSLLFASLLKSINLADVCFIMMENHLFVGVQIPPKQGEYSIRHKRKDWVLIELCDAWPMGRIPNDHHNVIIHGDYEVVDLH